MVALWSRFPVLVLTLEKEVQTVGWKSHLVVQGHGARQEQLPLNSKERFVLMLGHRALACYKGYLLLFMEVWNVYCGCMKPTCKLDKFSKGQHHETLCWIIACFMCAV